MHPACERCGGACCKGLVLDLRKGMNADEQRWLKLHGYGKETRIKLDIPCQKLEDGKCRIYDDRPGVCRQFKVGSEQCLYALNVWAPERADEVVAIISRTGRTA